MCTMLVEGRLRGFVVNYPPSEPPPWLVHKQFGGGSIPHGDTIGMSAAKTAASASSASCFRAKLPAKLAFVPYPWASSSLTMRWNRVPYFQTNLSCSTMNGDGLKEPKITFSKGIQ